MILPRIPGSHLCRSLGQAHVALQPRRICPVRRTSSYTGPALSTEQTQKPYYVTTPIYYVNAAPHIGHLYSSVLADTLARYQRLRHPSREVLFTTGTDEHGMKIQRAAEAKGVEPSPFCDSVSQTFRDLASAANISHTRFIRTTEDVHYRAAQYLWRELVARGWIYKGQHSGWYSVSDETFYAASQVEDVSSGAETYKISKETGSRVEWISEENYKFKLSAFREKLASWLENNDRAIVPAVRQKALLATLVDRTPNGDDYLVPLEDLSVSRPRSRLKWGVPVPDDPEHTIYVWVDALANYLTAIGYPWPATSSSTSDVTQQEQRIAWPADVQVIGKDIIRFHAVYWPAILMALDLPPPKTLLAHAHWTLDRQKMSKSRGNVADPFEAMETYGVDPVRYYLMRNGGLADDSDWSEEQIRKHYKRDLMGMLGNFLSRLNAPKVTAKLPEAYSYCQQADGNLSICIPAENGTAGTTIVIPGLDVATAQYDLSGADHIQEEVVQEGASLTKQRNILQTYEERMGALEISKAVGAVMDLITDANRLFSQLEPWSTDDRTKVITAHVHAHRALHLAGILLSPAMPVVSGRLLDKLWVPEEQRTWAFAECAFGKGWSDGVMGSRVHVSCRGPTLGPLFPKLKEK